ncbi:chalcone synthase [Geomonas sp. Red276]
MTREPADQRRTQDHSRRAYIGSLATVAPPMGTDQRTAAELLKEHFGHRLTARSIAQIRATFLHSSIRKRHFAIDEPADIMGENADQRVRRFTERSIDLSAKAVEGALAKVGLTVKDVTALVVNTCTGYICPGISTYLVERLGLGRTIPVYDLVGSGCGGAIPNLQVAEAMLKANGGVVVSVAVEICSAAFQMDNDLSLILSNAIFGDGAAAVVLWERPSGFELVSSAGRYIPEQRESIRFVHKNGQLHNQLSLELPELVGKAAAAVVDDLLAEAALKPHQVGHWALHTGGDKILNAVRESVGIDEEAMWATRKVLAEYGNMSSPTVLFVLEELLQHGIEPKQLCVLLAYGAGLSAHACLLRKM